MTTYAKDMAREALTRFWTDKDGHRCHSYDGERLAEVEAAINAVIERCAQAADPVFNDGSHPCEGSLKRAAARIRALAAPPARPREQPQVTRADGWVQTIPWPGPTLEMFNDDPTFEAVWQAIKRWDINVPGAYSGHMGATGNHVRAILDAIHEPPAPPAGVGAEAPAFPSCTCITHCSEHAYREDDVGLRFCKSCGGVCAQPCRVCGGWSGQCQCK